MNQWHENNEKNDWVDHTAAAGPAVLGAAAGMILGNIIHRGARGPLALTLLCVGTALVAPHTVQTVIDKVNSPATQRGSQRTLRSIRESAGTPIDDIDFVDEEVEMFV